MKVSASPAGFVSLFVMLVGIAVGSSGLCGFAGGMALTYLWSSWRTPSQPPASDRPQRSTDG